MSAQISRRPLGAQAGAHGLFQENRRLQTQLNEIQTHGVTGSIQPKVERDDAAGIGYTCREGICPVRCHPVCCELRIAHFSVRQPTR